MEFLVRNFDSTNPDAELDRSGCRKRGMIDQAEPDGKVPWETFSGIRLPKFVVIKVPGLTEAEVASYEGLRKVWRDELDYEVVATRPAQGEIDLRIFEKNPGAINQNAIAGIKATRIRDYLSAWGCSNFNLSETDATFTFNLWAAARSANFWQVPVDVMAKLSFSLSSYASAKGIATIKVTKPESLKAEAIERKISEYGGTVTNVALPDITFTLNRDTIIQKFRADVKERTQRVYMYQQHRIKESVMDQVVAAGGTATLTKAQFLAAIRDMAAE